MGKNERAGLVYALVAVFFFSWAPILVRWAAPLSPYQIAAGRLFVGSAIIVGLGIARRQWTLPARLDWKRFVVYGAVMAIHMATYAASLQFTTIAHTLTIVYSAPIFVALFSAFFLNEPISPRRYSGAVLAIAGLGILVGFEPKLSREMIVGDLLALASAITFALYSVAGRSQREHYSLFTYAGLVYGIAALGLAPLAAWSTVTWPTWPQIAAIVALGIIPTAIGHTLYNAAVRRTHAAYANMIATQEVTGGVILGALLLAELPGPTAIAGLCVALAGIAIVLL